MVTLAWFVVFFSELTGSICDRIKGIHKGQTHITSFFCITSVVVSWCGTFLELDAEGTKSESHSFQAMMTTFDWWYWVVGLVLSACHANCSEKPTALVSFDNSEVSLYEARHLVTTRTCQFLQNGNSVLFFDCIW